MFCENCGGTLQSYNKFCPKCGTPVSDQSSAPTPPAPAPIPSYNYGDVARAPMVAGPMSQAPQKKSGCGKILLILGLLVVIVGAGIGVAIYYGYRYAEQKLKASEAYAMALTSLKNSPAATEKLGEIKETGFPLGSFNENGDGTGAAAFRISVTGTKASGYYIVAMSRRNNKWRLLTGKLNLDNGEVVNIKSPEDNLLNDNENTSVDNSNDSPPAKPGKATLGTVPMSGGVLNGKATSLPQPEYPSIAKAAHVSGTVTVQVLVDETGQVTEAQVVSGHPLLQAAAVEAAKKARFSPTTVSGHPVKVRGIITYNFVNS